MSTLTFTVWLIEGIYMFQPIDISTVASNLGSDQVPKSKYSMQ